MSELRLAGYSDFDAFARDLEKASQEIRQQLGRDLSEGLDPLFVSVRNSAMLRLPNAGGLAARVAAEPVHIKVTVGAGRFVITLWARSRTLNLDGLDNGEVRHPTFGRAPVVAQRVTPGWWTIALNRAVPRLMEARLQKVLDKMTKTLAGRG